jgi:hypothetical protein
VATKLAKKLEGFSTRGVAPFLLGAEHQERDSLQQEYLLLKAATPKFQVNCSMVDEDPQAGDALAPPVIGGPPPPDGLPAVPPLRTWFTLAAEAELPLHSYAYHLFREHQDEDWEATMLPFTRLVEADKNPNYDAEEAMFEFADSLERSLFLVVKDSRFEVIYGMRRCTPIHGLGARVAWLMGDRQLVAGSVIPPQSRHQGPGAEHPVGLVCPDRN